jgi:hypothetical protein
MVASRFEERLHKASRFRNASIDQRACIAEKGFVSSFNVNESLTDAILNSLKTGWPSCTIFSTTLARRAF